MSADFAAWARQKRFVELKNTHLGGELDGIQIELDDGDRGDRRWRVVVEVYIAIGEELGRIYRDEAEVTPKRRALRDFCRKEPLVEGMRIDGDAVTMELKAGSSPAEVEGVIRRVIEICLRAYD